MTCQAGALFVLIAMSGSFVASASAHTIPWRAGETRLKAVGSCAKGPCMKRSDFSPSKPHLHRDGNIIFDRRPSTQR